MSLYDGAPALECRLLNKSYGELSVLVDFNLSVPRGRIVGLLGPAGYGKSTVLKIAAGLERPSFGELLVLGEIPSPATAASVSYMSERININEFSTVGEIYSYYADFFSDFRPAVAKGLLRELGLRSKFPIKLLSLSARRKLQLAMAMSRGADLYLLDEPTAWTDSSSAEFITRCVLANCPPSSTVVIASSAISEVEMMLDDFFFVTYGGRILLSGSAKVAREGSGRTLADLAKEVL